MPSRDRPPLTRALALRGAGFAVATVLGAVAVWLIVTSHTQKGLQIGVLVGLWGLLLGAYSMFGSRRAAYQQPGAATPPASAGSEVATRPSAQVERAEETAERREYELRLEQMLRREINATMNRQVSSLRAEIAQLRHDLLEKVGGQLRLERIETTRLIGSDLEALQHEVRQLKVASETPTDLPGPRGEQTRVTEVRQVIESTQHARGPARRVSVDELRPDQLGDVVDAEVVESDDARTATPAAAPVAPARPTTQPASMPAAARTPAVPESARPAANKQTAPAKPARPMQPAAAVAPQRRAAREMPPQSPVESTGPIRAVPSGQPAPPQRALEHDATRSNGTPPPAAAPINGHREQPAPAAAAPADSPPADSPPVDSPPVDSPPVDSPPVEAPAVEAPAVEAPAVEPPPADSTPAEVPAGIASRWADDPFASLPRIRPFTEFELDPIDTPANGAGTAATNGSAYTGRRRRSDESDEARRDSGRHSRPDAPAGGRRRRADDRETDEDLLRQLLSRQGRS